MPEKPLVSGLVGPDFFPSCVFRVDESLISFLYIIKIPFCHRITGNIDLPVSDKKLCPLFRLPYGQQVAAVDDLVGDLLRCYGHS